MNLRNWTFLACLFGPRLGFALAVSYYLWWRGHHRCGCFRGHSVPLPLKQNSRWVRYDWRA